MTVRPEENTMQPGFKLDGALSQGMLDILIKAGLVAALVIFSFEVFQPFLELMLWSVILAVTLYPVLRKVKARTGLKDGRRHPQERHPERTGAQAVGSGVAADRPARL